MPPRTSTPHPRPVHPVPRSWGVLRLVGRLLRAGLAALLLGALLIGIPWGLSTYIGWPLPHQAPTRQEIITFLTTPLPTSRVLDILACVLWPAWALFAVDVARTVVEMTTALPHPARIRPRSPGHALAAALVGMLTLGSPLAPTPRPDSTTAALSLHPPEPAHPDRPEPTTLLSFSPSPVSAAGLSTQREDQDRTVTVRPPHDGIYDSLWRIADRALGDGNRWPEIFALNQGRLQPDGRALTHPDLIRPGWVLHLPDTTPPAPDGNQDENNDSSHHDDGREQHRDPTPPPPPDEPSDQASPTPDGGTTDPSTPQEHPSQEPSQPDAPEPPPREIPAPRDDPGIITPTGAFVGLGLAALITAAWCTLRIRRRIHYRPGTAHRDDEPTMAPIVRALRVAHDHPPTAEDSDLLELEPAPTPAVAVPEAAVRERARRLAEATALGDSPAAGSRDGRAFAVDLARTRGLGLTGPGAQSAARALLMALLADHHRPGADPARLLIPASDATALLGDEATRPPYPPRLHVTSDLDAALDVMEGELLSRSRESDSTARDELVLLATPRPHAARRLQAVLENGSALGLTGMLLGPWHPGTTVRVREDGTIAAGSPAAPDPLTAGVRLFTLPETDARHLLDLLREPIVATPAPHTPHRVPSGTGARTPTAPPPSAASDRTASASRETPPAGPQPRSDLIMLPTDVLDARPEPAAPAERPHTDTSQAIHLVVLGRLRLIHRPDADTAAEIPLSPRHRELLAFLALHPSGAHRDAICATLWPESRRPHNAFHATVSQLRRALTAEHASLADLIHHQDGHYRLADDRVSVDMWQLQDELAAFSTATPAQQEQALRHIDELYQDGLAVDLVGDWLESPREALRREVLSAHSTVIRSLRDSDPDKALQFLEIARRLDPYNETIYRDIARQQARLGQQDGIPRTQALLETALAEIDEHPSGETLAFFDAVQKPASHRPRDRR